MHLYDPLDLQRWVMRRSPSRWAIIFILIGLNGCGRKLLFPEDAIIQQGRDGELAAAVDKQRLVIFTKGVPDTRIEFAVNRRPVGADETDKTGRASVKVKQGASISSFTARARI